MGIDYQEKEHKESLETPIQIDKRIHREFKLWCVANGEGIGEKAQELIVKFLSKKVGVK